MVSSPSDRSPSLRDYIFRSCADSFKSIPVGIVLAETANDLFRDSKYSDLIRFEEDIAQISDLVLLAGESAGSLAELGAFSMNPSISSRLLVLLRNHHYEQESFIRNGPIRFLENEHGERSVSAYPWGTFKNGDVRTISIKPHLKSIEADVLRRIEESNVLEALNIQSVRHQMIVMYWVAHVLRAAKLSEINEVVNLFGIPTNLDVARRYLYCMRVAGWVGEKKYGNNFFYYPKHDVDPFDYAFAEGARMRDHIRWKRDVVTNLKPALESVRSVTNLIGLAG